MLDNIIIIPIFADYSILYRIEYKIRCKIDY